jgi:hypothetical protein
VKPPTEIQIERRRGYSRFKYKKKADLVDEGDVGGLMEYHARMILGSRAERMRLESVARARGGADRMIEENAMEGGGSGDARGSRQKRTNRGVKSSGDDEVNWNFLEMGYTTMHLIDDVGFVSARRGDVEIPRHHAARDHAYPKTRHVPPVSEDHPRPKHR